LKWLTKQSRSPRVSHCNTERYSAARWYPEVYPGRVWRCMNFALFRLTSESAGVSAVDSPQHNPARGSCPNGARSRHPHRIPASGGPGAGYDERWRGSAGVGHDRNQVCGQRWIGYACLDSATGGGKSDSRALARSQRRLAIPTHLDQTGRSFPARLDPELTRRHSVGRSAILRPFAEPISSRMRTPDETCR